LQPVVTLIAHLLPNKLLFKTLKLKKMKKIILLLACVGLFISGCEKSDLSLPGVDENLKSAKIKMVPVKGDIQSVISFYLGPMPVCGKVSGNLSHLGKFDAEKSTWYHTSVDFDANTNIFSYGMFGSLCAPNGDLLKYTASGEFDVVNNIATQHAEFMGGTGRFGQAQGYIDASGYADDPEKTTSMFFEAEGMISNVGSSHGCESPLVKENEAIARAFFDLQETFDAEQVVSLFADEFIYTVMASGVSFTDKKSFSDFLNASFIMVPDTRMEVVFIEANEKYAALEGVWKGTNTGGWPEFGIPVTNKYFELPEIFVMEIKNGKIIWAKAYWDMNLWLKLIGVIP
jgi:steroid delta-isomerase-like uncharacterized protein